MNTTINHIPKNWKENHLSFAKWFIYHIKSKHTLNEDYILLKNY